jgi:hypothetical protein
MGGAGAVAVGGLVWAVVLLVVAFVEGKRSGPRIVREAAELNRALAAVAERTGLRYIDAGPTRYSRFFGPSPCFGSLRGARDGIETHLSIEGDEDEQFMRIEVVAPAGGKLNAASARAALKPASLPSGVKTSVAADPDRLVVIARSRLPRWTFLRTRSFPLDAETIHRLIEACVAAVTSSRQLQG